MASILFPNNTVSRTPKVHVTSGLIQPYTSPQEPPTKKSPWRQIRDSPLIRSLTITMTDECHQQIWMKLARSMSTDHKLNYAKVIMNLEDILTGSFFNDYVRIGNVVMIAEGVPGVDDIYTLQEGILRLELNKQSYQRAGLQGQIVKNHGARKHIKERFLVEINLRSPSMIRGKKGFDRLLYAAKNVLNGNKVWLFRDLIKKKTETKIDDGGQDEKVVPAAAIDEHHPTLIRKGPEIDQIDEVMVPTLVSRSHPRSHSLQIDDYEDLYEIVEWLDMVNIKSPRVQINDNPDPYISRYAPPTIDSDDALSTPEQRDMIAMHKPQNLKILKWTGLMDSEWIIQLIVNMIKYSRSLKSTHWISISTTTHETEALGQIKGYTILLQPSGTDVPISLETMQDKPESEPVPGSENENEPENEKMEIDHPANIPDIDMKVLSATPSTDSKSGLQHYICFQHVDS